MKEKTRILLRTRNRDTFRFRRNAFFYVSYKRQRQTIKVLTFLQYCVYLGQLELILREISHIRGTYADFNLTHLYKYSSGVQIMGYWTRHDVISSDMYDEYEFKKPHFMLSDDFDSKTKNNFN